jgi:hypothetical protein
MTETCEILVRGFCVLVVGATVLCAIIFIVGETVEHFTP